MKGYDVVSWYGVLAPGGTPQPLVNRLNGEINAVMKSAEMQETLSHDGAVPIVGTAAQFAQHIATEIARWRKVVKEGHIEAQ